MADDSDFSPFFVGEKFDAKVEVAVLGLILVALCFLLVIYFFMENCFGAQIAAAEAEERGKAHDE
jgi:hypothetical protein